MLDKIKQGLKKFLEIVSTKTITEKKVEEALWELKLQLISSDVSVIVADKISEEVKKSLVGVKIGLLEDIHELVKNSLRKAIEDVLQVSITGKIDLASEIKNKKNKPYVIALIGVNGVGKTLTAAKIAYMLKNKGLNCILAASDTFRAGSIEQLEKHGSKLNIKVIKQGYGSDAAAVAYDAINYAKARNIDAVIIDTAGRVQTDKNLMEEVKKIIKVAEPDLKIFIGDALTGNDMIRQAEEFNNSLKIDGSILTKVDADVKGGAALSISYITKKPILFIGVGGDYKDLEDFNANKFIEMLMPN
ncbi:MAG: signal recognition particle-docking protein FtsY [Candidatus Odinarchaeum yellowstonii]|uniref:Signal recognition particle receptor FtsY n=1 Tax=Odinarchaeota yellowstonii (strain LCB_4) TaxID=1841599 RepID=A0AAF0IBV8_ODILC|nr:MAG: signal recognition particle-docking protein FtsY [Candidatus Odinarchaeum yellowstonii]